MPIVFTLSLLSLAGIPITAGFIGKFYLIYEGMHSGLVLLFFVLIINSAIGLFYYLRVITAMFSPSNNFVFPTVSIIGKATLALITIGILLLGIYPG